MIAPVRIVLLLTVACLPISAQTSRSAIERALPVLAKSAATFVEKRPCFSCHHNTLPILTLHMAQERGFSIDTAALGAVEAKTFVTLLGPKALDDAIQAVNLNDPTPDDSMLLMAAGAAGLQGDLTNEVLARRLARWQRDGHWVTSDFRPPHSSSVFTATATAIRAIAFYMPPELSAERDAVFARARTWLTTTKPQSTEDASFRLMGLAWSHAPSAELGAARRDLLATQKTGGGWGQTADYPGDAYSTGEALYALHESGTASTEPAWRRGEKFLIDTQAADGTWHVATRMISPADVSPRYFSTGFPYEHDEYLSYAGTCWAVMALVSSLPERTGSHMEPKPDRAALWLRTALFGTTAQLQSLLDSGVDPNTLLIPSAHDPEKVKLLLARGADGTFEALTVATAYRDTAASVEALLAAGAPPEPPSGIRVKHSPLVLAASTGDLATVRILLAHGADPSGASQSNTPIATAIMFGYPDIVRALIKAGANANIRESTGINLMHWATITGHPEIIPVLAEAKVPVNAVDDNGFTPLMYAATIDFGSIALVDELLKAGANRTVKNDDGRTPLEQALFYHHERLAAALR